MKENNIDNYVRGLLSNEERAKFELLLAYDLELQKEVEFTKSILDYFKYKKVSDAIQLAKYANENNLPENFDGSFDQLNNTMQTAKLINLNVRRRNLIIWTTLSSAAVFLAIFCFKGIFPSITNYETSKLRNTLTINTPEIETVSSTNKERIKQIFDEANQSMQNEDYATVIGQFNDLRLQQRYETDEMLLFELFINYKNGEYYYAIEKYKQIRNLDSNTGNEARWYISWVYMEINQIEKAKEELGKLKGYYKKQAIQKLASLN